MLRRHKVEQGEVVEIELPSGEMINIEVTADTASITLIDRVLFSQDLDHGEWVTTWPKPE